MKTLSIKIMGSKKRIEEIRKWRRVVLYKNTSSATSRSSIRPGRLVIAIFNDLGGYQCLQVLTYKAIFVHETTVCEIGKCVIFATLFIKDM